MSFMTLCSSGRMILETTAEGFVTVAKLPRLSYTISNSFERDDRSDGKARTETGPCGSNRSRTGFAPDNGAALDQSRAHPGGAGRPRDARSTRLQSSGSWAASMSGCWSCMGRSVDVGSLTISPRNWNDSKRGPKRNGKEWRHWCFPILVLGLKAGRKQLQRLLKLVCEDKVAEIAITYEDRLTRFGQAFLETLFSCFGVTLTILDPGEENTPEQELTADLLALIASFSGRMSGMRSHKQKELVKCVQAVITSP